MFHHTRQGCEAAQALLETWLPERGLKLKASKTHICHLKEGFDFLGFNIRHYAVRNRKNPYITLIKPSKSSVQAFRQELRGAWKQTVGWSTADTVAYLNPKIRGWCHYFRIGAAKETFALLDQWMWQRQRRYVRRRHPNKSQSWQYNAYWGKIIDRQDKWVFQDRKTGAHLLKLAWTPIRRHTLVKGNASPDNPALKAYWQHRQMHKIRTLTSSTFRELLWKRQKGRCLVCGQGLDNGEKIHCHHRQPKNQGGDNRIDNLCLLHQACHQQVHSKHAAAVVSNLLEPRYEVTCTSGSEGGKRSS